MLGKSHRVPNPPYMLSHVVVLPPPHLLPSTLSRRLSFLFSFFLHLIVISLSTSARPRLKRDIKGTHGEATFRHTSGRQICVHVVDLSSHCSGGVFALAQLLSYIHSSKWNAMVEHTWDTPYPQPPCMLPKQHLSLKNGKERRISANTTRGPPSRHMISNFQIPATYKRREIPKYTAVLRDRSKKIIVPGITSLKSGYTRHVARGKKKVRSRYRAIEGQNKSALPK
jgi:hypothetical protein